MLFNNMASVLIGFLTTKVTIMTIATRINHVKSCSDHLSSLGYIIQCVDEYEGTVYILGTDGNSFHMHKLYTVRKTGDIRSRNKRLERALMQYTHAFNMKDM